MGMQSCNHTCGNYPEKNTEEQVGRAHRQVTKNWDVTLQINFVPSHMPDNRTIRDYAMLVSVKPFGERNFFDDFVTPNFRYEVKGFDTSIVAEINGKPCDETYDQNSSTLYLEIKFGSTKRRLRRRMLLQPEL